ncbi:MAG: hypothetical protein CMO97_03535 [Woeseia sp.]|nr:hypothetical protein [Woeseia sp.]
MRSMNYNQNVQDYFANLKHTGEFVDGVTSYLDDQGIRIKLSARIKNKKIANLCFLAWGCPHIISATEFFCRTFESCDIQKLEQFEIKPIMQKFDIPIEKTGRILVLEDAVKSLKTIINKNEF